MKRLFTITTLFIICQTAFAQLVDKWDATYSSDATVNDMISDPIGNVYTLITEDNGSDFDIKLIKYDKSGTQQWVRTFASNLGNDNDYGIKLQLDASNNIYFLGSINPEETSNGLVLKKYNSSGTQQYEYTSTGTVGPVPYDFVISSSNEAFISAKRFNNSTVKNDARLYRISSSGSFSALATYEAGGAGTDQIGYRVGITGSDVKVAVVDGTSNLRVLTYPTNFSTGTDNQTGNRRVTLSGTIDQIDDMYIEDANEIYIYGKEDGAYFLRRHDTSSPLLNEFTIDVTNMDQINSMYVDASSNIYFTGYESISGAFAHNELIVKKYNSSGTQQFETNLKPNGSSTDHQAFSSSGTYIAEDASGDLIVAGNLVWDDPSNGNSNLNLYVGAVTFSTSGVQQDIYAYGNTANVTPVQAGILSDDGSLYFAGESINTVYFYGLCDPPAFDLGADVSEDYDPSGNSYLLDAGTGYSSYLWSNGSTSRTTIVTEEGTYTVTVTNSAGCPASDDIVYTIDPIDQTITWNGGISGTYGDPNFPLNASSSSGLDITYTSSDNNIAEPVLNGADWELEFKAAGNVTITASQAGNDNYNAASDVEKEVTITPAQFYWVGNGGDLSDFSTNWVTSSGGSTFHTFAPDQYCDIFFDANSFSSSSQTVTNNSDLACRDFIVSGVLNNPTFDFEGLDVYGSVDFSSNAIYSIYALGFASDEAETVDFNGSVIDQGTQTERWTFYGSGSWEFTGEVTFDANRMNVNNGEVIIGTGVTFTTSRPIILASGGSLTNNGTLIFESGANFLNQPGSSFSGNDFTFKRNTTFDASTGKYSIVGSPITNASTSSLGSLVYAYDESQDAASNDGADRFVEVTSPETMSAGAGYFSAYTGEISVTGIPNTGTIDIALDYSTSGGGEAAYDGFNLVANPYPAGLIFQDFIDANGPDGSGAIESAIYLWVDGGSDVEQRTSSDYMTINSIGTVGGNTTRSGDYNTLLGSFQGFFVKATGTGQILSFTESMRHQYGSWDDNFFRKEKEEISKIKIGLTSSESYSETLIGYLDDATSGVDSRYDAQIFSGNAKLNLASIIDGKEYAIQGRNLSTEVDIIPLSFETTAEGMHSFDFTLASIPDGADILLLDKYLDQLISINDLATYTFQSAKGEFTDRFELLASTNKIILSSSDLLVNEVEFEWGNSSLIGHSERSVKSVIAYGIDGSVLAEFHFESTQNTFSIPVKKKQVVIVKTILENGLIDTQKFQTK